MRAITCNSDSFRQIGDDVFAYAVGKVLLLGVAAHIGEGEDGYGRFVGRRRRFGSGPGFLPKVEPIDAHRPCDILEVLIAEIGEQGLHPTIHLLMNDIRSADAARLRNAFKARRYVDPIAKDIVAINNNVADIDANTELDLLVRRYFGISLWHGALNLDGTTNRIDRACKLHQRAVARSLDDAAAMLRDLRIDDLAPVRLKCREGPFLINPHQSAISGDIGR